jgi:PAS domain S-box-containing protein/putative nucleotidyltransferase with HDIG domain
MLKVRGIGKSGRGGHVGARDLGLAGETVRKSEIDYRDVFEAIDHAAALIEDDLTITLVNGEFERLSGYDRAEIEGKKKLFEFLAPHDAGEIRDYFAHGGENYHAPPKNYKIIFTNKQGEPVEAAVILAMVPQSRKSILSLADVRKLREAEESLKISELRFRSLFENSPVGITLANDVSMLYANPAFLRMFGLDEATKLQGQTLANYITPIGRQLTAERPERGVQGQDSPGSPEKEAIGQRKDGTTFPVQIETFMIGLIDGSASVAFISDISERKQAEEELALRAQLLDGANDSIVLHDFEGRFHYANDVACRFYGYTREELMQKKVFDLAVGESTEENQFRLNELKTKGRVVFDAVFGKDGALTPVEINANVLEVGGRQLVLSVARDITERKRAEERQKESHAKLAKTFEQTVESLASIAEMRDPYTAGHQVRVARLACEIASESGMSTEQISAIRTAATLHDIGKMIVPHEILNKPGKLNALERSFVEAHAQASYEILKKIEFALPVAEIILQHHERLNGSGYPRGLSGDSILKEARVLAVADVVEAMASYRPYRPALPLEKALEEISCHRGTLYDADVVDACLRLFSEKDFSL